MDFSLALIRNSKQIHKRKFTPNENDLNGVIFNIEELSDNPTQMLFVDDGLYEDNEFIAQLAEGTRDLPVKKMSDTEGFLKMEYSTAQELYKKTLGQWTLQNNLLLLDQLFPTLAHLKSLWPNDRTSFFEELWPILKRNLGAHDLKIIYNHMIKGKKENEKNRLVKVILEGENNPNPVENQELGEVLFKNYQGQFPNSIEVKEYDPETGHLVILAEINKSPIIIMGTTFQLSSFQKTLISTFFDGLQDQILQ
jgi:hypothetical protein